MDKKQQNEHSPRQNQSSADQHFESTPDLQSIAPPALQLKANGITGEGESEQEKGAYQLKEKEFSSSAEDNPSDGSSPNTPFQLKENTANNTGLPDNLKSGVENLSGFSLDDVKVHYNSSQPAQLQAHAYAQGSDIHIGRGQEKHLPHETWHVVQQKQGRVQPTTQLKGKFQVNDDKGLEKEADMMGAKAMQMKINEFETSHIPIKSLQTSTTLQRFVDKKSLEDRIAQWEKPLPKLFMQGVLDTNDTSAAAKKIYDNMFAYASGSWKYKASHGSGNGVQLIEGGQDVGMCETYRNAFQYMLKQYAIPIFNDYEPLSGGITIEEGQELVSTKFVTKKDKALLGKQTYNVTKEIDAKTGVEGNNSRYLFSSHWQLIVNGQTYDPLFQGVNQNDSEWTIVDTIKDVYIVQGGGDIGFTILPNGGPTPGGEFAAQYIQVNNISEILNPTSQNSVIQNAHKEILAIKAEIEANEKEWIKKKGKWTGKAKWLKNLKNVVAPNFSQRIDAIAQPLKALRIDDPSDNLLSKVKNKIKNEFIDQNYSNMRSAVFVLKNMSDSEKIDDLEPLYKTCKTGLEKALETGTL